jgi:hypothetical protein
MMKKPEGAAQPPESNTKRKPYTPPRIEESGQFEHLVLTCAKVSGGPPPCALPGGAKSAG